MKYVSVNRGTDSVAVTYWYHRQFIEAARERYCGDEKKRKMMHRAIAEYFLGRWANGQH